MITLPTIMAEMKELYSTFFIDLYVIKLPTGTLYYAACDESINWYIPGTSTTVKYMAIPIQRDEVKSSVDSNDNKVTLRISNVTDEFTTALLQSYDFRGCDVNIYQIAYPGSLTDHTAYNQIYAGEIDAPSLDCGKAIFEMTLCQKIPNLHSERTVSINCNAWFGDSDECGATKNIVTGTTSSSSTTNTIYSDSLGSVSNFWNNGTITIGYETKKVKSCGSGYVIVEYPFFESTVSKSFYIEQGCDKTLSECSRFSNTKNYGGFPSVSLNYGIKYS